MLPATELPAGAAETRVIRMKAIAQPTTPRKELRPTRGISNRGVPDSLMAQIPNSLKSAVSETCFMRNLNPPENSQHGTEERRGTSGKKPADDDRPG